MILDVLKNWAGLLVRREFLKRADAHSTLSTTYRASLLNHGDKANVRLGEFVIVDGTLECYEKGELIIGDYSFVGRARIFAAHKVEMGTGVLISDNVVIMDSDLHSLSSKRRLQDAVAWGQGEFPDVYSAIPGKPVFIADHVWIGANSVVLKGITINEGAIIGAGSVVTRDVPPYTIVAGNPARVIRELAPDER